MSTKRMELYQDLYRARWDEQNKIDRDKSPSLRPPHHNHYNRAKHIANGKLGGAPMLKLTKEAETIDRMLKKGMTVKDVAEILSMSVKDASNIVKRFRLPRK
tara:strand:+ start:475 stop:780 length:306 start_codon:yes stop_codon:yes gene_type:complete